MSRSERERVGSEFWAWWAWLGEKAFLFRRCAHDIQSCARLISRTIAGLFEGCDQTVSELSRRRRAPGLFPVCPWYSEIEARMLHKRANRAFGATYLIQC